MLKKYVCTLPLCGVPIDILHLTINQLALNYERLHDIILTSLWEGTLFTYNHHYETSRHILMNNFIGVISQKEVVRLAVTKLLSSVMPFLSDVNITNRIVPALITLSNDSNRYLNLTYFLL